jgi:hypothetical protein
MKFEGYSLEVTGTRKTDGQYVYLDHGQQFAIVLANSKPTRCNVALEVNGKSIATYRIENFDSITLERPLHCEERFTFYREGTLDASLQGLKRGDDRNGLIVAKFFPEVIRPRVAYRDPFGYPVDFSEPAGRLSTSKVWPGGNVAGSYRVGGMSAAGGVGYSGESDQEFMTAEEMEVDASQMVEIAIRLLAMPEPVKPKVISKPKTTGIPPRRTR